MKEWIVVWLIPTIIALNQYEEFQRYDGWQNNLANPGAGAAGSKLHRDSPHNYYDGIYLTNQSLPSARELSTLLFKGKSGIPNQRNMTSLLAFFSQVVAYEVVASNGVSCPLEILPIKVEKCDPVYDPKCEGESEMPFTRATYDKTTGKGFNSPREQINERPAYIDASFVYGITEPWVASLRSFKDGRLAEGSIPRYPPLNNPHIPLNNPPPPQVHRLMSPDRLFMLGDPRVNENPGLLSFGLVLFRWHNFNADKIRKQHPHWNDEQLFQGARRMVIASLQKIIAYDYIPALLGAPLSPYTKYKPHVPPGISHSFATAAFRYPHSMVPPAMFLRKLGENCEFRSEVGGFPALRLCQNWWNAQDIVKEYSVDEIVLGMASQIAEREDNIVVEDLRDYIFGPLHYSRLDVVASSIMRGRDNGLASYNALRRAYNLEPKTWETINPEFMETHKNDMEKVKELYRGDINLLDAYVGGMIEGGDNGPGELFSAIIKDQFQRIRDSDRFWFENKLNGIFTEKEVEEIRNITLYEIIKSTTDITETMLQKNVFFFNPGDPCPQPYQLNNTNKGLEECVPPMKASHFSGNEVTYIFTLIVLVCCPIVCYGIGYYLTQRRGRVTYDPMIESLTGLLLSDEQKSKKNQFSINAFEWLHPKFIRKVSVRLQGATLIISKPSGTILRKIEFAKECVVSMWHSPEEESKRHGPFVLISTNKSHDLVLRFFSLAHFRRFLDALSSHLKLVDGVVQLQTLANQELLQKADTKDKKQKKLNRFFREAYARVFNDDELKDSEHTEQESEILDIRVTREELAEAMGMRANDMFTQRLFAVMASQLETTSFKECLDVLKIFTMGTQTDKLQLIFKMCDIEKVGRVRREDLANFIHSVIQLHCLNNDDNNYLKLIRSLIDDHSIRDEDSYLTFEEFEEIFTGLADGLPISLHAPGANIHFRNKDTASVNSFELDDAEQQEDIFSKAIEKNKVEQVAGSLIERTLAYLETYRQHTVIVFIFVAVNLLFFFNRFWHYNYMSENRDLRRVMGVGIAITRGAAGSLSICMALILLTVCRNSIRYLRSTWVGQYVPFDSAIGFHKIVAYFTLFWASLHTVGHCVNFYHVATQSQEGLKCLFQEAVFASNFLPSISYWFYGTITGLTGLALVAVMSIIYVFAMPIFVRHAYHAFRLTHLLNILFYALTFLHGLPKLLDSPKFWIFTIIPIFLFIFDRILGMRQEYVELPIEDAALLPSDIIYIKFKRPKKFKFESGQWVRISSPSISCAFNECHAFSLASAPHLPFIELYIKAVGPWTHQLRHEIMKRNSSTVHHYPVLHLTGPYGDGNQEWGNYEVAVMVGGGIGITPYASTLQDLVHKVNPDLHSSVKCKKVYFLWVCPKQKNYEWFVNVLRDIEEKDTNNVIETHIFVTRFFHKFDLRTTMLYMCEKHFQREHDGKSLFTGLRAKNHFGRPVFKQFFNYLQNIHGNQREIGVFSCGPAQLNEQISHGCSQANRRRDAPSFAHKFETF